MWYRVKIKNERGYRYQHQAALQSYPQMIGYRRWHSRMSCSLTASNNQHPAAAPTFNRAQHHAANQNANITAWQHGEASSTHGSMGKQAAEAQQQVTKRWRVTCFLHTLKRFNILYLIRRLFTFNLSLEKLIHQGDFSSPSYFISIHWVMEQLEIILPNCHFISSISIE